MNIVPPQAQQLYQPRYLGAPREEKKKRKFTPLPYSYKYIIEYLIKKRLLKLIDLRPPPYPLPYHYNLVEHCEYHQSLGHTIDRCYHLRHDIQDLIKESKVLFNHTPIKPPPNSNIIQNPLPNHQSPKGVNMISLTSTQFNPSIFIIKMLEHKKIIFLPNTNQVSTLNGHSPVPIPPPKYEHLLRHMWDMALNTQ